MIKRIVGIALVSLIVLGTIYQTAIAGRTLADFWRTKILANRRLDAVSRSADVAFGQNYSEYIRFLVKAIPQDAVVVIPTERSGKFDLNSPGLMQYFLFPRQIHGCGGDCANLLADADTYIVAQGEFPSKDLVPPTKRYLRFSDALGLYIPEQGGN